MTKIDSYFRSDVGQKRTNNEDAAGAFEPKNSRQLARSGSLYVVADGLGGHQFGEKASAYAVETLLKVYYEAPDLPPEKRLRDIIQSINQNLITYARENVPAGEKVATTVVAAVVRNGNLQVAHVGDSRAYLLRDGELRQITKDHSFVGELMRAGSITEEEAQQSPYRNRLMRSLGGKEATVEVDVTPPIPLQPGDLILLCTDGLTQYAGLQDILAATRHGDARQIVERLIQFANGRGGSDNITVSVIKYGKKSGLPAMASWKTLAAIGAGVVILALFAFFGVRFASVIAGRLATSTPTLAPTATATLEPTVTLEPTGTPVIIPADALTPAGALPAPGEMVKCEYSIQAGDTFSGILLQFQVTLEQVLLGGQIVLNPDVIKAGDILTISGITAKFCETNGGTPTQDVLLPANRAPVIDSIQISPTIACNGTPYAINIHFHDSEGDAYQLAFELVSSKLNTAKVFTPKEFTIDHLIQIAGADYPDFFSWDVPGDEVRIRVTITDRTGLSGSSEFSFVCSE